jgi:putative peptidoglycan lipid II flippase
MTEASEGAPVKKRGLLGSSFVVSMGTLLSRVLGLVRDVVFANLLGAAPNADAFFVAFKIPNFLRRLFSEGAFSQAFVPVLTQVKETGTHAEVKALIDRVAGVLGGSLFVLTAFAMLMAPWVALIFAPGFSRDVAKLALTADLIVWTFPYLLLISLTGFCGAILNTYGRFAVPAYTPVLLNMSLISAAIFWAPTMPEPALGLAMGVAVAGVVQLLFQLPSLHTLKLTPRPGLGYTRYRRSENSGTDGPGPVWCFSQPNQFVVRYGACELIARWQCGLAVLLRSPDGAAPRCICDCYCNRDFADFIGAQHTS